MTINNAINFFKRLVSETHKKPEIELYSDFIKLLTNLENRKLTVSEVESIEKQLDTLELNRITTNKKRYFRKALQHFKHYLKDAFSLMSKGYYTALGITCGASIGLLLGVLFLSGLERSLGIALGLSVGTFIGLIIASYWASKAKAAGNLV